MFLKEVIVRSNRRRMVIGLVVLLLAPIVVLAAGWGKDRESQPSDLVTIHSLPDELTFAGEVVPLEWTYVREAIEREVLTTSCMHTSTTLALRASTRYFPVIEPILKEHGIPSDFKYLCVAESGLNENAQSPARASGLWQFLQNSAKEYGLEVGDMVDERYHLELSTHAACEYLKSAYELLGSWTLAAAAYNAGRTGVVKRLDLQGVENYWDLLLPEETMRYVPRIMSFKLLMSNPKKYGFDVGSDNQLRPFSSYIEIEVSDANIVWSELAARYGTTYRQLRILNPWIRGYEHENKGRKRYLVKMPKPKFRVKR